MKMCDDTSWIHWTIWHNQTDRWSRLSEHTDYQYTHYSGCLCINHKLSSINLLFHWLWTHGYLTKCIVSLVGLTSIESEYYGLISDLTFVDSIIRSLLFDWNCWEWFLIHV